MQSEEKCTILSLNVRGLRDKVKRRSIFSFLKDQKAKFYFLQETFSDANDEAIWKNEWGGEIVFFLTADTTAKVFASSLIHRNKPRLIFHIGTLREE